MVTTGRRTADQARQNPSIDEEGGHEVKLLAEELLTIS